MTGIRREEHHYTDEQVRGHLRDTLAVLDDLAVPDDVRPIAFQAVWAALSAKQVTIEQVQPALGRLLDGRS